MAQNWKDFWCALMGKGVHDIAKRIEGLDRQQREVRHDLRNIQARTDALTHLVETMQEDTRWRRPDNKNG